MLLPLFSHWILTKLTLLSLTNWSPPDPSVHGILQARILEWVAIPISTRIEPTSPALAGILFTTELPGKPGSEKVVVVIVQWLSRVRLSVTPWTAAHQASLSFTTSQSSLKLMSIESVMPSNHFILCHPLVLLPCLSQHQGLFQWVSSSHQVAKVLEPQLQHQSFQWIFRSDFL